MIKYVGELWRDVLVPDTVVCSDGLTAEVGGLVELPLLLYCEDRTSLSHEPDTSLARMSATHVESRDRWVHELVGRVVEVDSCLWADGWVLDVHGLAIYVQDLQERSSDPPAPLPEPGSWVRARGELSIAQAYETDAFEPADDLLRRAERQWHVRRIVRLDHQPGTPGSPSRRRRVDVPVMHFANPRHSDRWWTLGYLLDLEHQPST
jgi:hypothetical protein